MPSRGQLFCKIPPEEEEEERAREKECMLGLFEGSSATIPISVMKIEL